MRQSNIRRKILLSLTVFVLVIVGVLMLFQTVFLEQFYENFKLADIRDRADALLDQLQDDEFATYLEDAAQGGDMCVHVINADGRTVAATNRYRDCAVHRMGVSDLRRIFLETRAAGGAQTRRFTMPVPDAAMQGTRHGALQTV